MSADSYTKPNQSNPEAINILGIDSPDIGAYLVAQDFYLDTQKAENLIPSVQNLLGNIQPDQFQSLAEFIVKPIYDDGTDLMYDFSDDDTREHEEKLNSKGIPMGVVRIVQFAKAQELATMLFNKHFPEDGSLNLTTMDLFDNQLIDELGQLGIPNSGRNYSINNIMNSILVEEKFLQGVADTVADKFPVCFLKSNTGAKLNGMSGVNGLSIGLDDAVALYPEFLVETLKAILPASLDDNTKTNRATFLVQKLAEFENPKHIKVFKNTFGTGPGVDVEKSYAPITEHRIRQKRVEELMATLTPSSSK
jgi:hypothetical protein